jgi:hypothetical protein
LLCLWLVFGWRKTAIAGKYPARKAKNPVNLH